MKKVLLLTSFGVILGIVIAEVEGFVCSWIISNDILPAYLIPVELTIVILFAIMLFVLGLFQLRNWCGFDANEEKG